MEVGNRTSPVPEWDLIGLCAYPIKRRAALDNGNWNDIRITSRLLHLLGKQGGIVEHSTKALSSWFPWRKPATLQIPWKRSRWNRRRLTGCVSECLSHQIWFQQSPGCDFYRGDPTPRSFCIRRSWCATGNIAALFVSTAAGDRW